MGITKWERFWLEIFRPFVERWELSKVYVVALLAKQHAFSVSPPGEGKTALAKRLLKAVEAKKFSKVLNPSTQVKELIGPIYIDEKTGKVSGKAEGYILDAEIAFLDEIFKARGETLNILLDVLEEREITLGPNRIRLPLWSVFSSSNEVPPEMGEEGAKVAALYDRFTLRVFMNPLPLEHTRLLVRAYGNLEYREARTKIEYRLSIDDFRQAYKERVGELYLKIAEDDDLYLFYDSVIKMLTGRAGGLSARHRARTPIIIAASAAMRGAEEPDLEDYCMTIYALLTVPEDAKNIRDVFYRVVKDLMGEEYIYRRASEYLERFEDESLPVEERLVAYAHAACIHHCFCNKMMSGRCDNHAGQTEAVERLGRRLSLLAPKYYELAFGEA